MHSSMRAHCKCRICEGLWENCDIAKQCWRCKTCEKHSFYNSNLTTNSINSRNIIAFLIKYLGAKNYSSLDIIRNNEILIFWLMGFQKQGQN